MRWSAGERFYLVFTIINGRSTCIARGNDNRLGHMPTPAKIGDYEDAFFNSVFSHANVHKGLCRGQRFLVARFL